MIIKSNTLTGMTRRHLNTREIRLMPNYLIMKKVKWVMALTDNGRKSTAKAISRSSTLQTMPAVPKLIAHIHTQFKKSTPGTLSRIPTTINTRTIINIIRML